MLHGGRGGKGNSRFATPSKQAPRFAQPGQKTLEREVELELKTIADVGLIGLPNVGKSTLINRIAGQNRAEVGDRPGVTRGKQWVKITPYLELMDTPGMLWPKLEDQELAKHLAYLGSIKDEVMDSEELALDLLAQLQAMSPSQVAERYSKLTAETPKEDLLKAVCLSRGFLLRGGELDTERAAHVSLDEFRAGKVARVTLEQPEAAQ